MVVRALARAAVVVTLVEAELFILYTLLLPFSSTVDAVTISSPFSYLYLSTLLVFLVAVNIAAKVVVMETNALTVDVSVCMHVFTSSSLVLHK